MVNDVKRITGTVAEIPEDDRCLIGDNEFTIRTDDGRTVGRFRLDGHDIKPGDWIEADWRSTLHLTGVLIIRGEGDSVQHIPEIQHV
jgi:hypothetical protein